jgi:hypothetical protein
MNWSGLEYVVFEMEDAHGNRSTEYLRYIWWTRRSSLLQASRTARAGAITEKIPPRPNSRGFRSSIPGEMRDWRRGRGSLSRQHGPFAISFIHCEEKEIPIKLQELALELGKQENDTEAESWYRIVLRFRGFEQLFIRLRRAQLAPGLGTKKLARFDRSCSVMVVRDSEPADGYIPYLHDVPVDQPC